MKCCGRAANYTKMSKKPIVLIICDYYLPGFQSGGGMRTIVNMVDRLGDLFDFRIVTRDHDGKLDRRPYPSVKINEWNEIKNAKVYYLSKNNIRFSKLLKLIKSVGPEIIYFNSFFATPAIYTLVLKKLIGLDQIPVVLAPCGELSAGALQIKKFKKKVFIALARLIDLYGDIIWKASSELEREEIELYKGRHGQIMIAPDLPPSVMFEDFRPDRKPRKIAGRARMIFLSRFVKKKNFNWLLPILSDVRGDLEIDIWGPLEDEEYWAECQRAIKRLPANVKVEAKGLVPHEKIYEVLVNYDFFVLPTLGENFGHVFLEALAAGCPLVISDRTPWLNLPEQKIGWDLSLDEPEKWRKTLERCIELDEAEYRILSNNSRAFLERWLGDRAIEESTLSVLEEACGKTLNKSVQIYESKNAEVDETP